MAHILLAVGIVGVIFLVNGFRAGPEDSSWGQFCNTGVCIHPEWIVIGAGLITFALAVFVLKPQRGERQP